MKINANENVLLMSKKMKAMSEEPTPAPEAPVSNPETGMKALEVMGQKNIMFQGGITKAATEGVKAAGKKLGKGAMVAAAAAMLAGCVDQLQVVNLGELAAAIAALQGEVSNLRAEQAASNATQIELLRYMLSELQEMYASQNAFYSKSENFYKELINNMVDKEMFLDYLGEDSPIYTAIMEVIAKLDAGQVSARDAYDQIIKLLTNIDTNVESILKEAKSFNEKADTIIANQVEAGKISKERYEEYKAFCEKAYEAILAGNMTLEEFKNQTMEKFGDIVAELVNNSSLISKLTEQVKKGFSTSNKNQERLIGIAENLNETESKILEQSITNGDNILAIYKKMLENGEINQTQYDNMMKFLNNWYDGYIEDTENTAEYRKQVLDNFSTVISNQTEGNKILKEFAATEEINDTMTNKQLAVLISIAEKISNDTGYISSVEYQQLLALLENNNKLDALLEQGTISQAQRDTIIEALYNLEQAQLDGNASVEKYGSAVLDKMSEVIKTVADGDTAILSKLNAILKSNKTTNEKLTEMTNLLASIDAKIDVLIAQNEEIKTSLATIINNQVEQNNLTKEKAEDFLKAADEIKAEIEAGNINANNYYTASYQHWFAEDANHATIIQILVQNGYTQQEATKYLKDLDEKAEKGEASAKAAFEELMSELSNISAKIDVLIAQNEEIKTSLATIINNQVEHNNLTKEQGDAFLNAAAEIKAEIEAGNINANNYYTMSYKHWFAEDANHAAIIQILVQNGYTQQEATKYLKDLDEKAEKGEASAKAAFEEIMNKLNEINGNVEAILQKICEYGELFKQYFDTFTSEITAIKKIMKDVRNGVTDISSSVSVIRQKIGSSLEGVEAQLDNIAALIEKADANNVSTMTEGKDEIIAVLETLGYSQTEILKMSMDEVKAAIEKNGQYIQNNGAVLNKILSYVAILPEIKESGDITNTKIDKIINKLNNLNIDVEISPETLAELEALLDDYFKDISDKLDKIDEDINTNGENITEELKKTNANVTEIKGDVKDLNADSKIQIAYDQYILDAINNVGSGVTNIEEIAAQIGVDVSWIREHGGGSGSTVDLSKIENYLKQEVANTTAINAKLDLMLAAQEKDSGKMDEAIAYLKSLDSTTKSILDTEKNFKDMVIAEFAAFGIQMDENNEWLEKIYNKKCDCAKDVTIVVEKIYKYLTDGNEGIVDYDDLFDDLFGDDSTKAVAMASTPKTNSASYEATKSKIIMADEIMHLQNKVNKKATGKPMSKGVYAMGNMIYTVSGDLDKTMPVADFYKTAERIASEPTYKEIRRFRHFNDPQTVAKRNANKTSQA